MGDSVPKGAIMRTIRCAVVGIAAALSFLPAGIAWAGKPIPIEYQALVSDWYLRYLGRPVDARAMENWGRKLARDDNPTEIEAAILGGREYFQRNGGNNIGFIRGLFRDVLGAEPVGGQLEYWLAKLHDLEFRDDLA